MHSHDHTRGMCLRPLYIQCEAATCIRRFTFRAGAQGIGALESSAKSGSLQEAKKSFVTAVSALQTWAESAGIAASLKGL